MTTGLGSSLVDRLLELVRRPQRSRTSDHDTGDFSQEPVEDWLISASERSSWEKGVIGEKSSFYWLRRDAETAPEYKTPILSEETIRNLQYNYISAFRFDFSKTYTIRDGIELRAESPENDSVLKLTLTVDDFERWASVARLYQNDFEISRLPVGGRFYVDFVREVRDALPQRHIMFEGDSETGVYSTEIPVSAFTVGETLEELN